MNISAQHITKMLVDANIRPSAQRIAITGFLLTHPIHPTAEQIYNALLPDYPTLSRTTVYNTLKSLAKAGKIVILDIEPGTLHFDGNTERHAHFICNCCRTIYDIELSHLPKAPDGFIVKETQIAFRGICSECQAKN